MGEYLTIIWEAATPSAAAVPWDNTLLVVDGDEAGLSSSTTYACTSDTWSTVLTDAGFASSDQAYKSTADFFAASPTPGGTLYVLGLVSGTSQTYNDIPLVKVDEDTWETPIKPPAGWASGACVDYYPDGDATGHWQNCADGSAGVGFTIENDEFGNWNGQLTFVSGLSGVQIDDPPAAGCKITASFTVRGDVEDLGGVIDQYDINLMAAAYENEKTKDNYPAVNCYFGSQANDLGTFTNAIAGKNCIFFWALPGSANPNETGTSLGDIWANIKNVIGSREDVALIKATPSALQDDMAAGYMGMTAGEHPHNTLTFKAIHMGIDDEEGLINRAYWKNAQVACPMTRKELSGSPNLITYGFTLGTGYSARINYVRCKYIIAQELKNTLWALLASRKVKMSYDGMQLVKKTLKGLFKTLEDQGIVDGLEYINIPVENDLKANNAAGKAARAAREIPSIEIGFLWFSTLEKITITGIKNEA